MNLYFVTCQFDGVWRNFAYWADCAGDATNQAIYDGATGASTCPTPASPYYSSQYRGPDFAGRRLYKIDFVSERGEFAEETMYVAADTTEDAAGFADEFTNGRYRFIRLIPPGTELDFVEPGWDQ